MKTLENKDLQFLDANFRVHKLGIKKSTFSNWIRRCKIDVKYLIRREGAKGIEWLIHPDGLPEPYKSKYYRAIMADAKPKSKNTSLLALERLPKWQRDIINHRAWWVQRTRDMGRSQLNQFLLEFSSELDMDSDEKTPSIASIYRWRKAYKKNGILGLSADYGTNEGQSGVHPDDLELYDSFTMNQASVPLTQAWELVKIHSYHVGNTPVDAEFPSLISFERAQAKKHGKAFVKATRSVSNAIKHVIEPRLERDFSSVLPGQIYVMDHRTVDVLVWNPKLKKAVRPYLTAITDYKTAGWLAWSVHFEASNVSHVQTVTAEAIRKYGKPNEFYLDNGKDFRAHSFSGGRNPKAIQAKAMSMLAALRITPIWAIPYNSEAKNIEPAFKRLKARIEPFLKGYTAGQSHQRPDATKALEKSGKESDFISLPKFIEILEDAIRTENFTVRKSGVIAGYNPIQLLEERKEIVRVSEEELAVLTMITYNPITVNSTNIKIKGKSYGCSEPWFILLNGKKVLPRIDPNNKGIAYIYNVESQQLLGTIKADFWVTPARPSNAEERALLEEKLTEQKKVEKFNKKRLKTADIDIDQVAELLKKQADAKEFEYRQTGTLARDPIINMERTAVFGATLPPVEHRPKKPLKLRPDYSPVTTPEPGGKFKLR